MFGDGLELIGIGKKDEEKKSEDSCSHDEGEECSVKSLDLGNGPADFIFNPE